MIVTLQMLRDEAWIGKHQDCQPECDAAVESSEGDRFALAAWAGANRRVSAIGMWQGLDGFTTAGGDPA